MNGPSHDTNQPARPATPGRHPSPAPAEIFAVDSAVEPLESRLYFTGYKLYHSTLKIYGNRATPNRIVVSLDRGADTVTVKLDGQILDFRQHAIRYVQIWGGSAGDFLGVDQNKHMWIQPVTIVGGGGNDTIIGGNGNNELFATGTENAYLQGGDIEGALDSTLVGSNGNDTLNGGAGGNDLIFAGKGNQLLEASSDGYNVVFGGTGNDTLVGSGNGSDLLGYIGNNVLRGIGGMDTIYGGQGSETVRNEANGEVHYGIYPAFVKFRDELQVYPPT